MRDNKKLSIIQTCTILTIGCVITVIVYGSYMIEKTSEQMLELELSSIIYQLERNEQLYQEIWKDECGKIDYFTASNEEFEWEFSIPCDIMKETQEIEKYENTYTAIILFKLDSGCENLTNLKVWDVNVPLVAYPYAKCGEQYHKVYCARIPAKELQGRFKIWGVSSGERIEISIYIHLCKIGELYPPFPQIINCGMEQNQEKVWSFSIRT